MKKFLVTFLLLVFGISMSTSAQEATKRITKQPKATENPLFVAGPWTESSNTISENFEGGTFPPAGWAKLNPDNGTGWALATVGVTPIPGWNGGTVINAPGVSGTGMAFMSYQLGGTSSNDSWLITPQLLNVQAGDSLKFKLRKFGTYADNLDIKISTTVNNNTTAFTINVATIALLAADSGWTDRAYEIGSLVPAGSNIYIAFREHVTDNLNDGAAFFIDEVRAGGAIIPVEFGSFYSSVNENTVVLNWSTATETNNLGFEVERKSANGSFVKVGFVSGKGTTTNTSSYSYSELMKITGFGEKVFEQSAGFLKISEGDNPLDNTFIHPESYDAVNELFKLLNVEAASIREAGGLFESMVMKKGLRQVAEKINVGEPTLQDILDQLKKPGRDPRSELPPPILRSDVLKMEDLQEGMKLKGTVRNVVDFGAFVDIGVKQDGLLHVSQMRNSFVKNPLDVLAAGDIIEVTIIGIDKERGRISLSLRT